MKKEDYIFNKIYEFADQRMSDIIETTYLPGKRPIDICNIHRSHIFSGVLHITQQKTGKKVRFKITDRLKEIFKRRLKEGADFIFTNTLVYYAFYLLYLKIKRSTLSEYQCFCFSVFKTLKPFSQLFCCKLSFISISCFFASVNLFFKRVT